MFLSVLSRNNFCSESSQFFPLSPKIYEDKSIRKVLELNLGLRSLKAAALNTVPWLPKHDDIAPQAALNVGVCQKTLKHFC